MKRARYVIVYKLIATTNISAYIQRHLKLINILFFLEGYSKATHVYMYNI